MTRQTLSRLALATVLTLPLGTVGCSDAKSPTEPDFDLESSVATSSTGDSGVSSVTEESRGRGRGRGNSGNNNNGNNGNSGRRGRGQDDQGPDDRGGRRPRNPGNQQNPQNPQGGLEFEGTVTAINGGSLTLATGTRVIVDGRTQWNARGDLLTLDQLAGSFRAGQNPRVEGRGTRQANGTILAQSIKAEFDQ